MTDYSFQPQHLVTTTPHDPTAVMGRRILAWILDAVLFLAVAVGTFAIFAEYVEIPAGIGTDACDILQADNPDAAGSCFVVNDRAYITTDDETMLQTLASVGYLAFFVVLQGLAGGSPGKLLTGLRVVGPEGNRAGIGKSLIRTLLWIVDAAPWIVPLVGFIVGLTSTGHRRIGDMAAKTYVIGSVDVGYPVVPTQAPPPGTKPWGAEEEPAWQVPLPEPSTPAAPPSSWQPTPDTTSTPPVAEPEPAESFWSQPAPWEDATSSGSTAPTPDAEPPVTEAPASEPAETGASWPHAFAPDPASSATESVASEPEAVEALDDPTSTTPDAGDGPPAGWADHPEDTAGTEATDTESAAWYEKVSEDVAAPDPDWWKTTPAPEPIAEQATPEPEPIAEQAAPEPEPADTTPAEPAPADTGAAAFVAPGSEPEPAAEAEEARDPNAAPPPQWDEARNTYIQWDPARQQWLQWDTEANRWKLIDT